MVRWSRVCPPGPSSSLCWGAAHSASPASSVSAVNVDAVKEVVEVVEVVEEVEEEALEVFFSQEEEAVVEEVVVVEVVAVVVVVEMEGDVVVEGRYLISHSHFGLVLVQRRQRWSSTRPALARLAGSTPLEPHTN